ncbi:MAG: methyltransferase family protein [Acidobacteriota bacterium]
MALYEKVPFVETVHCRFLRPPPCKTVSCWLRWPSPPHRIVRHPVYIAMAIAMIGASIVTRSVVGLLAAVFLFLPAEIHRARLEERALEERFGTTWAEYAARTGFFVPRFARGRHA